ncbi:hypothetical protein Pfo_001479 [Paulownia fortunei]|nr:hypothetical protein Pfo_001479 [Paulownia fortunei]
MIKVLNISAQKLRKLTFVNMGPNNRCTSMCIFQGKLKVHTPNLVSFCYIGPVLHPCEFSNMLSLNHALIQVQYEIYTRVPCPELSAMISGFDHAKELSLSAIFVRYFSPALGGLCCGVVPFHYLRCLKLELVCDADHMEGLINLLKLSPNLEVLCVKFNECRETRFWKSREEDVSCLSHHLKEIEITTKSYDSTYTLEFIKFFLQNGKSLEKMKIMQKKRKVNSKKLYALQAVQLASKAISVSVISISASGKRDLLQFVYRKCGVSVRKQSQKLKFNQNDT